MRADTWARWQARGARWSRWHALVPDDGPEGRAGTVMCMPAGHQVPAGAVRSEAQPPEEHSCTRCLALVATGDTRIKMSSMVIVNGIIRFPDGSTRTETIDIGHYMSQATLDALRDAYLSGDEALVDAVMDRCLTEEYMPGHGPLQLVDVESIEFPG